MEKVVIAAAARTPIGKFGGVFREIDAVSLSIPVLNALVERSAIQKEIVEDVIWGCNYQKTYKENNLARISAFKAGFPETVSGITVHRNCTSSMSAIHNAYFQIKAGEADVLIAGGAESMSTAPYVLLKQRWGSRIGETEVRDSMWDSLTHTGIGPAMGITAENLAERYGITRTEQDSLALLSQNRAVKAISKGLFTDEIVPVQIKQNRNEVEIIEDENPRKDLTIEDLSRLKPAFKEDGTVTAGNSSGINDGAAGLLMMSGTMAERLGINILGEIVGVKTAGVAPEYMGIGPVPATRQLLERTGLDIKDMDIIEVNEAFAAQYLAVEKELKLDREITNVNGSGISLGHPVGATGTRIVVTMLYQMHRKNLEYGLATLCAGGGMGTSVLIRRI